MRFLLDVNVGVRIARALESAGHDVHRAALSNRTTEDPDLLALAVDGRRILVTYDRDFSNLVFAQALEPPPAIIYLRVEPDDVGKLADRLLAILDEIELDGHLTVVTSHRVRRKPFATRSNDND